MIRTISKITRIAGYFIKFFIILALSVIVILKYGVRVENFAYEGVKLEQLYLKLDKKLIFKADKIEISDLNFSKNSNSQSEFLRLSHGAYWMNKFFSEISLKSIIFGELSGSVIFKDDVFYVDSPYLKVDIKIGDHIDDKNDHIVIKTLEFKDFNLTLNGDASANFKDNKYAFTGNIASHELSGKLDCGLEQDLINYKIYDANATSLKNFMNAITEKTGLDKEIKSWIFGNVVAQSYHVDELSGKIDLAKKEPFLNELKGRATAKNLSVLLAGNSKEVPPITASEANITLDSSKLGFELFAPRFSGHKLDNSSLYIYDMFDEKKAGIFIDIRIKDAMYDANVDKILKFYGITLPILQTGGKTSGALTLDVNFNTLNVLANGKFYLQNPRVDIAGAPFSGKNAVVDLRETFKVDINASEFGMDFFKADGQVSIDASKSVGEISGKLRELKIDDVVHIKDENVRGWLDFNGVTKLGFDEFGVEILLDQTTEIFLKNGVAAVKFSPLLKSIGVSDLAKASISTSDFKNFSIDATKVALQTPFANKNSTPYNKDDFKITATDKNVVVKSASGALKVDINGNLIALELNGLDILSRDNDDDDVSKNLGSKTIELDANNSNIVLIGKDQNRTLELGKYFVTLRQNYLKMGANAYGGRINYLKEGSSSTLEARDIDGKFVNEIFKIDSFEGGKFKLKVVGTTRKINGKNKSDYKGEVRFYDTYLRDYIFYQQLLTFINSVPALLTFKTPDFNQKGFSVQNGKVLFQKRADLLELLAIDVKGSSADILGGGTIDLDSKQIDVNLQIEILKDASSIIEHIPIVNQILLGRERKLSTLIELRGTTDKPKYSSQVITDTLLAPFKIIRNVLEIPFLIFE